MPMVDVVELITETGAAYRTRLRPGTPADRTALVNTWLPMLEDGPEHWLDREWAWDAFGLVELHVDVDPEWLVVADELESGASGELLGVLVTTGPVTAQDAGCGELLAMDGGLIWVEYIAIAPSIRPDCPTRHRRKRRVKGVGRALMCAAIARSLALDLGGCIGLHAEGPSGRVYAAWGMRLLGIADHRVEGTFPVFFGDATWAAGFPERAR